MKWVAKRAHAAPCTTYVVVPEEGGEYIAYDLTEEQASLIASAPTLQAENERLREALTNAEVALKDATEALATGAHHTMGKKRTESIGDYLNKAKHTAAARWADLRAALTRGAP